MSSHLFVVQSNIKNVLCDAWVMPAGRNETAFFSHYPHKQWLSDYAATKLRMKNKSGDDFADLDKSEHPKLVKKTNVIFHLEHDIPDYPRIYSLNVATGFFVDTGHCNSAAPIGNPHCQRIVELFNIYANDIQSNNLVPLHNRERFVIALPVIGTGGGGYVYHTGIMMKEYLETIQSYLETHDLFDVILCVYDRPTLIAAQKIRHNGGNSYFPAIGQSPPYGLPNGCSAFDFAGKLAMQLAEGKLVLFIGGDTNLETGVPTREELYDEIAYELGIDITSDSSWTQADTLSKAEIIQQRCRKTGKTLGDLIAEKLTHCRNTLQNIILAGLECPAVVTVNCDQIYENAVRELQEKAEMSVIPNRVIKNAKKWLLKLNGCISSPDTIVASRQDTLRYMETNAALAGIVQAKLLTSHLLFVGFALDDETFHQIMDSVTKSQRNTSRCVGTSLQTLHNHFTSEIWDPLIQCISMKEVPCEKMTSDELTVLKHQAHRQIEIFLDLLLMKRTVFNSSYILDSRFTEILSHEERIFQQHLQLLANTLLSEFGFNFLRQWPVCEVLKQYGWSFQSFQNPFAGRMKTKQREDYLAPPPEFLLMKKDLAEQIRMRKNPPNGCEERSTCIDFYCKKTHSSLRTMPCRNTAEESSRYCQNIQQCEYLHPFSSRTVNFTVSLERILFFAEKLSFLTKTRKFVVDNNETGTTVTVFGEACEQVLSAVMKDFHNTESRHSSKSSHSETEPIDLASEDGEETQCITPAEEQIQAEYTKSNSIEDQSIEPAFFMDNQPPTESTMVMLAKDEEIKAVASKLILEHQELAENQSTEPTSANQCTKHDDPKTGSEIPSEIIQELVQDQWEKHEDPKAARKLSSEIAKDNIEIHREEPPNCDETEFSSQTSKETIQIKELPEGLPVKVASTESTKSSMEGVHPKEIFECSTTEISSQQSKGLQNQKNTKELVTGVPHTNDEQVECENEAVHPKEPLSECPTSKPQELTPDKYNSEQET